MFSVVDSVLLRPLPFAEPSRLVALWEHTPSLGIAQNEMAPANFFDLRKQNDVFQSVAAYSEFPVNLTIAGLLIGSAGALTATRVMTDLLYGVIATDAITFISVGGLLIVVALVACYVPARRATKVDPLVALRGE